VRRRPCCQSWKVDCLVTSVSEEVGILFRVILHEERNHLDKPGLDGAIIYGISNRMLGWKGFWAT
jgi:hypothetical protein